MERWESLRRSRTTEKLVEMFAADAKKKVNQSLAQIIGAGPFTQPRESAAQLESYASHTEDMVYHMTRILRRCKMAQRLKICYKEYLHSDYSDASCPDEVTDAVEFCVEDSETVSSEEELSQ